MNIYVYIYAHICMGMHMKCTHVYIDINKNTQHKMAQKSLKKQLCQQYFLYFLHNYVIG